MDLPSTYNNLIRILSTAARTIMISDLVANDGRALGLWLSHSPTNSRAEIG